jgi:glutamyl-tRNA reductase
MSAVAVASAGASHHHAPLALLDRLAYRPDELPAALEQLIATAGVRAAVILSTCNRTEVYATFAGPPDAARLARFLAEDRGGEPGALGPALALRTGGDTIRHLFRVAAGLDSMVRFEIEIQAQVRAAAELARGAGTLGMELDGVFRRALSVGRRVRREVAAGAPRRSLGRSAVDEGAAALGGLRGRTVLVLGTGKIATVVVERVRELAAVLLVCSRSRERAGRLAGREGRVLELAGLDRGLAEADLVIACTAAPRLLVEAEQVGRVAAARTIAGAAAPLVIVDLAVPRTVDPAVRGVPGALLLDLEDLGQASLQDAARLAAALQAGERLAEEEARRFLAWTAGRQAGPIIAALRQSAEELCERELERALGGRSSIDRVAAGAALHRTAAKLLHGPTVMVKEATAAGDSKQLAALCRMFGLDTDRLQETSDSRHGKKVSRRGPA